MDVFRAPCCAFVCTASGISMEAASRQDLHLIELDWTFCIGWQKSSRTGNDIAHSNFSCGRRSVGRSSVRVLRAHSMKPERVQWSSYEFRIFIADSYDCSNKKEIIHFWMLVRPPSLEICASKETSQKRTKQQERATEINLLLQIFKYKFYDFHFNEDYYFLIFPLETVARTQDKPVKI